MGSVQVPFGSEHLIKWNILWRSTMSISGQTDKKDRSKLYLLSGVILSKYFEHGFSDVQAQLQWQLKEQTQRSLENTEWTETEYKLDSNSKASISSSRQETLTLKLWWFSPVTQYWSSFVAHQCCVCIRCGAGTPFESSMWRENTSAVLWFSCLCDSSFLCWTAHWHRAEAPLLGLHGLLVGNGASVKKTSIFFCWWKGTTTVCKEHHTAFPTAFIILPTLDGVINWTYYFMSAFNNMHFRLSLFLHKLFFFHYI